jgi:hypothetical protein
MARGNRSSDIPHSEYLLLSIIATGSKPKRSAPWMAAGVLIALGAALIFVLGR